MCQDRGVTAQSGLTLGQLAAALCLKTEWIDEPARNGHISCTIDQYTGLDAVRLPGGPA